MLKKNLLRKDSHVRGATGIIAPLLKLVRLQQPNARTVDVERAAVACHHAGLVKKPVKALSNE